MKRKIAALWLILVIMFGFIVIIVEIAPPVKAKTIYVDDSGGADYTSIQLAIYVANDGDTVFVYNGTYHEFVLVNVKINLIGEDRNSTIIDGGGSGTVIRISAEFVNMSGFTITNSGNNLNDAGIEISGAQNCKVFNNTVSNSLQGIRFHSSDENYITGNNVSNNNCFGISIFSSSDYNIITGNTISNNSNGIYLESNHGNEIIGNTFFSNSNNDVHIKESSGVHCSENTMIGRGIFIEAYLLEDWNTHYIDISNTVNGKHLCYWKNQTGGIVPSGAGQVILANCTNVKIENERFTNVSVGIELGCSINNNITYNNISGNKQGICLYCSDGNNIKGNTVYFNDKGICFYYSDRNIFLCNIASSNNWDGFHIDSSHENIIVGNNISSNMEYGIYLHSSSDNIIFHNNIIDNTIQAYDDGSDNYWDNGYPSGGNYWDDHSNVDEFNGPNQDQSGNDGICDSPYSDINGGTGNQDNYPLVEQWVMDNSPPIIELISPSNNSVIKSGIMICISIFDLNLYVIKYLLKGGYLDGLSGQPSASTFGFNTTNWLEGNYQIEIYALDIFNNENTTWFNFTIDSSPPTIILNSPENNSLIDTNVEINLTVQDSHLKEVAYSLNNGSYKPLSKPYSINTNSWPDGKYIITVYAEDEAGNFNRKFFVFNKDLNPPEIKLNSPENNTLITTVLTIDFEISDVNLDSVSYSVNQKPFKIFSEPFDLDISDWGDGEYIITIKAEDAMGNINERWFVFRIEIKPPSIDSSSIDDGVVDIPVDTEIIIEFDEPMDTESVESAISITPYIEYICLWGNDNKSLTLNFSEPLDYETLYQISISTKAKDLADRGLESRYEFEFTTEEKPKKDEEAFPIIYLLILLLAVIVAVITVLLVMTKKKKAPIETVQPQAEAVEAPQTIQFTCSNCNNLLQVNDTGMSQNVICPFCSTLFTVQSQKAMMQIPQTQQQPQQQTMQISCPSCKYVFNILKTTGPMQIQCPNCWVKGTLR